MNLQSSTTRILQRLGLLSLGAVLCAMPAFGRQLTVDEAISAAVATAQPGMQKAAQADPYQLCYTLRADDINTVYVVANGSRYLILAADDVATPLLGYADGVFDADNMPPSMAAWLRQYSDQISYAAAHGLTVYGAPARASYASVAPIVKTQWDQGAPYNDMCPTIDGVHCYTGCVATAVAQVMNTYKWPVTGKNTCTYTWNKTTLRLDFSTVTFKWDEMINSYAGNQGTTAQREAVAELMYACGISAKMGYGTDASGASGLEAASGLIQYLDYDPSLMYCQRDYYGLGDWMDLIYAELSQGHPVYYDGATESNKGHAFVIDGYSASDGLVHVNWGWSGMSDGYFQITTLLPDQQGIGGASSGFGYSQAAIFGLKKPVAGSTVAANIVMNGSFKLNDVANRVVQSNLTIGVGDETGFPHMLSYSTSTVTVTPGVKIVSAAGQTSYVFSNSDRESRPLYAITNVILPVSAFPTVNGTYTVTPVFRHNGTVYDMPVLIGCTKALTMTVNGSAITFQAIAPVSNITASDIKPTHQLYAGRQAEITAKITNTGDEYYGLVSAKLLQGGTTAVVNFAGVMTDVTQTIPAEVSFQSRLSANLTPGTYQIAVYDASGNEIGRSGDITVLENPTTNTEITISGLSFPESLGGTGTKVDPYQLDKSSAMINFTLNCTSGYFDTGTITMQFYYNAFYQRSFGVSTDILEGGESQSFRPIVDMSGLKTGYAYDLRFKNNNTVFSSGTYVTPVDPSGVTDVVVDDTKAAVYPNPVDDTAYVSAGSPITAVDVYALDGTHAARIICDGSALTESVDLSALMPGHYILVVNTTAGPATARIIKK